MIISKLIFFTLFLLSPLYSQNSIYIKDIRFNLFILRSPSNITIPIKYQGETPLFLDGELLGRFVIDFISQDQSLCRLVTGNSELLSESCYIVPPVPVISQPSPQIAPTRKSPGDKSSNISVPSDKPNSLVINETPPETNKPIESAIIVSGFKFTHLGDSIISDSFLSFTKFNSIENLNSFISSLNSQSSGYVFNIPAGFYIKSHISVFTKYKNKFVLCLLEENHLGYAYIPESGEITFKFVSSFTVADMPEKFIVFLVGRK